MLLVNFRSKSECPNGSPRIGIAGESRVVGAEALDHSGNIKTLLADGAARHDRLFADARSRFDEPGLLKVAEVTLLPPVLNPDKILCLGVKYHDHARDSGLSIPRAQDLFAKFRTSLIGAQDDIIAPSIASAAVDFGVELAVVIGQRASRVAEAEVLGCVAGYAMFNDVSARDLQMPTSKLPRAKRSIRLRP